MITTQGFRIGNLPQLPLIDGRAIVADPRNFSAGLGDMMQLARQWQAVRAERARQEELNALREKRMAAAAAGYDITTNTAPGITSATNAQNDKITQLAPLETLFQAKKIGEDTEDLATRPMERQLKIGDLLFGIQQQPQKQALEQTQTSAAQDQAEAARLAAQSAVDNADTNAMAATTEAEARVSKAQLELQQANDAVANAPGDMNAKRRLLAAQIEDLESRAAYMREHAGYFNARATGQIQSGRQVDPYKENVNMGIRLVKELKDSSNQVIGINPDNPSKPLTLGEYRARSRNPSTGVINKGYNEGEENYNAHAEALMDDLLSTEDSIKANKAERKAIEQQKKSAKTPDNPEAVITYPGKGKGISSSLTPAAPSATNDLGFDPANIEDENDMAAYRYISENPNDPSATAILNVLRAKYGQ